MKLQRERGDNDGGDVGKAPQIRELAKKETIFCGVFVFWFGLDFLLFVFFSRSLIPRAMGILTPLPVTPVREGHMQ